MQLEPNNCYKILFLFLSAYVNLQHQYQKASLLSSKQDFDKTNTQQKLKQEIVLATDRPIDQYK